MAEYQEESDESLMERLQGGDHQAFATLVRRHTNRFYAVAYRTCGQQHEAEDIVQDAFLKLWNKPQIWDATRGAKFTTWFYKVVTNMAIDHMRRKKPAAGSDILDIVPDSRDLPEAQLQEKQKQETLEAAIQTLPDRQKQALNLCFYEGLSNKEAAAILGVSLKALESLLMRAKAGLRDELTRSGFLSGHEGKTSYAG